MKKGFTLVEILVVIAIIGILTAVGVVSYVLSMQKSRDSRRQADLELIRSALEMYKAEDADSLYPDTLPTVTPFMPNGIPQDPKTGSDYNYYSFSSNIKYCLEACLEVVSSSTSCSEASFTSVCAVGTTSYIVQNP